MQAIVIGAGGTSRDLVRRMGEVWEVTAIDPSPGLLDRLQEVREVRTVVGDGASRPILQRAGLEAADALVAATDDDDVNLEVCRLGREAGVLRIVAVAVSPERQAEYRELGVSAFCPASLTARQIELNLETRRIASRAFADGRAEAIEFRVEPDSPVRDKALRELHSRSWLVGAILREGGLIIPHGETRFQTGDLVTVVGAAADFGQLVRTFTSGQPRFPLDFGKRVAVSAPGASLDGTLQEAAHLTRNSRATSIVVVHRARQEGEHVGGVSLEERLDAFAEAGEGVELERRPVAGSLRAALAALPAEESVGVVVMPGTAGRRVRRLLEAERALSLCRRLAVPVLIARQSHPYDRILVGARRTDAGRAAARAAIDLARAANAELVGLAAVDPPFIAGPSALSDARSDLGWLQEEAAVQGVRVHRRIRQGNPVHAFLELASKSQLVVLGLDLHWRPFKLPASSHVIRRVDISVLIVPVLD